MSARTTVQAENVEQGAGSCWEQAHRVTAAEGVGGLGEVEHSC